MCVRRRAAAASLAAVVAALGLTACTPPTDHVVQTGYTNHLGSCGPYDWKTLTVTQDIVDETHGLAGVQVWASKQVSADVGVSSYVLDPATRVDPVPVPYVSQGSTLTLKLAALPEGRWNVWVTWPDGISRNNTVIRVDRTRPHVTVHPLVALGKGVYRVTLDVDEPAGETITDLDGLRYPDSFDRYAHGSVSVEVRAFLPRQSVIVTDSSCNVARTELHLPVAPNSQFG
jgi:hypothetical protein